MKHRPLEPGRVRLGLQHVHVEVDGKFLSGMQMTCTECGATDTIVTNKNASSLPDQVIIKKFQQKGWEFRSNNTRRYCPSCVAIKHKRGPRVVEPAEAKVMIAAVSAVPEILPNPKTSRTIVPSIGMTTEQRREAEALIERFPLPVIHNIHKEAAVPENTNVRSLSEIGKVAEPDKDTKRRIFRAIDDNWDESNGRYLGNHSDQFISEDLKVPRIWVERIRVENFGEAADNQELHAFKAQLEGTIADVTRLAEGARLLLTKYDDALKELKELKRRLERIETSILPRR